MDMDREKYLLGRAALKTKIKALAFEQKRAKSVLRVIRKLTKSRQEKEVAIKAAGYEFGNALPSDWECVQRRMKITAYLNVYAKIRSTIPHKVPDWYYSHLYSQYVGEADALFNQATNPVPVA